MLTFCPSIVPAIAQAWIRSSARWLLPAIGRVHREARAAQAPLVALPREGLEPYGAALIEITKPLLDPLGPAIAHSSTETLSSARAAA